MFDGPAAAGNSSKLASPPPSTNLRRHRRPASRPVPRATRPQNTPRCRDRRGKQDDRSQGKQHLPRLLIAVA
jgi:hypothetical protein